MQREFGGYLPLELPHGQELYTGAGVLRLNCGRNAIVAALRDAGAKKVYLPYYNCNTVYDAVTRAGFAVERYPLDARRLPVCPALGDGEWLLYVNYFGIASDDLLAEVKRRWPRVIFDNTQAFFSAPRMDADSYNVYSCRKFVGVPDGAYLVHTGLTDGIYPADTSWQHAAFLFRCIDESVNSAYGDSLDNESRFDGEIRGMSPLTRRILASVEYDALRLRRRANYEALHAALAPHNALDCPAGADAMIYPFLCRVDGLRGRLIKNKVYVSQWWKYLLELLPADSVEADYSRYLLPLPIDQRYTPDDMRALAALVLTGLLGVFIERVAYRPLRSAPRLVPLISAFGVSYFLQDFVRVAETFAHNSFYLTLPSIFKREFVLNEYTKVTVRAILIVGVCLAALAILYTFIHRTKVGSAIRCVSQNQTMSALLGIHVNKTITTTFFVGAAMGGVAGTMFAIQYGMINPYIGITIGNKAFTAAVFGGIGSIPGSMLGGVLLGLIESLAAGYLNTLTGGVIGSGYKDIFAFVVLIVVLIIRPHGLLGRKTAEKV